VSLFGDFSDLIIEVALVVMLVLGSITLFARPGTRPIDGVNPAAHLASRALLSASLGLMMFSLGISRETVSGYVLAGLGLILGVMLLVRGLRLRKTAHASGVQA
jgi:hypothetical protein